MDPWYEIQNSSDIDSPALVIYEDRVRENIARLVEMIDDIRRLRPHIKTHKTREGIILLIEAGIQKFKCATISEADLLGSAGGKDVLLAYQPVGPKMDRFISLIQRYPGTRFSCLVDNAETARQLSEKMVSVQVKAGVYLDINVGMNRTGLEAGNEAFELYQQVTGLQGIQLEGLHVYDGHIHDTDMSVRIEKCEAAFRPVEALRTRLEQQGHHLKVVAGGSPTFPIHAKEKEVECSPGTFIFWDAGYGAQLPEQHFLPAALVISRIISLPGKGLVCTDLGHKSVASENPLNRRVFFLNAPELEMIGHSEEHLVARTNMDHRYRVGDVLYGLAFHICPTCALYERAIVVKNGVACGEWRITGRDRKINV